MYIFTYWISMINMFTKGLKNMNPVGYNFLS